MLVLLYVAALVQLGWIVSRMPAVVATHYDAAGHPNGSMTRGGLVVFQLGILAVTAGAFLGLPALLGRISPRLINLPNREYWLSPERRAATLAAVRNWMAMVGSGTVLLMMAVAGLNFRANQETPPRLSSPAIVSCILGYLLYVAALLVRFYRMFPRPPDAQRT
jgi:hypothetical protein